MEGSRVNIRPSDVHQCTFAGSCCMCGRAAEAVGADCTALVRGGGLELASVELIYVVCDSHDHAYVTMDKEREVLDPFTVDETVAILEGQ